MRLNTLKPADGARKSGVRVGRDPTGLFVGQTRAPLQRPQRVDPAHCFGSPILP